MRVLIADDDKLLAETLARMVRACGHEVVDTVTGGGVAVIQSFARNNPDVVLLDIMMPRCNGLTVCHALLSRNPDAKVVFISGSVEAQHPFVSRCGAVGYLPKPVLLADLQRVLDTMATPDCAPDEEVTSSLPEPSLSSTHIPH
jgi:two-component system response regulator MprA